MAVYSVFFLNRWPQKTTERIARQEAHFGCTGASGSEREWAMLFRMPELVQGVPLNLGEEALCLIRKFLMRTWVRAE
jgi:hypothetical protein